MRLLRRVLASFWLAALGIISSAAAADYASSLAGRLLVADAGMPDPRFAETVIFLVRHDRSGAFGLVINRRLSVQPIAIVMKTLGLDPGDAKGEIAVHYGGPVESSLGFILHTTDYAHKGTFKVTNEIALTAEPDVLRDIAGGRGPRKALFALGYAGWGPGQLEGEMRQKSWISVPADGAFVFEDAIDTKWKRATARRGVDL
jgi:putative transcriptional regulator